jgi:hypothetical protein
MARRCCFLILSVALLAGCMPSRTPVASLTPGSSPAMQTMEGRSWTGTDWPRTGLPPDRDAGKD